MLLSMVILALFPGLAQHEFYRGGVVQDRDPRASPLLVDLSGQTLLPWTTTGSSRPA